MTRFRLFLTLFMLTVGVGMAGLYLRQSKPAAPARIEAHTVLPAAESEPRQAFEASQSEPFREANLPAASAPTVAVPDQPLLRSATQAPPIETSAASDVQVTVRHDAVPGSLDTAVVSGDLQEPAQSAASSEAQGLGGPRRGGAARASAASRPRPEPRYRNVESLFTNPLGYR